MSSPAVTVELDDSLAVVNEIFTHTEFHNLLVVENGKLFGVVSDRDLFKSLSPNLGTAAEKLSDTATLRKKVHQIMTRNPISIGEHETMHKAIEIFLKNDISCIPVVDNNNVPVGVVAWRDLLKAIKNPTS